MAKSVKVRLSYVVSDNTDYSNPRYIEFEDSYAPDEVLEWRFQADTSATTVATGTFVDLVYVTADDGDTHTIKILAGEMVYVVDVDPATSPTLTADTSACECDVVIMGS